MNGSANISRGDGAYRYHLARWWADGPRVLWIMLNPSTADATKDDPTIRRCIGFARKWGFAGIEVVNLFAFRSPNPSDLSDWHESGQDVVGPLNDRAIWDAVREVRAGGGCVIAAWGAWQDELAEWRVGEVLRWLPAMRAVRITATGSPGHPLYVPYSAVPQPWPASRTTSHTPPPPLDPGNNEGLCGRACNKQGCDDPCDKPADHADGVPSEYHSCRTRGRNNKGNP